MNLKRYVRALYRPDEAFDGWTPAATVALAIVLVLCALNAVAISTAGDTVASHVSGTVTVDNPSRPPDWVCNDNSTEPMFRRGCNASKTMQKPLRPAARDSLGAVTLKAFFAPFAWVLLTAFGFVLVSGKAGGSDGGAWRAFRNAFAIVGIAAVPAALRYAARPLVVRNSLDSWTYPHTLDGVGPAAASALFPNSPLWLAIALFTGAWTVVVLYFGIGEAFETPPQLVGGVAVLAGLAAVGACVFPNDGWVGAPGGAGLLLVLVGLGSGLGAYTLASIRKTFDLIGYRGSRNVEPREWYVGIHRLISACVVAAGFVFLGGLALA